MPFGSLFGGGGENSPRNLYLRSLVKRASDLWLHKPGIQTDVDFGDERRGTISGAGSISGESQITPVILSRTGAISGQGEISGSKSGIIAKTGTTSGEGVLSATAEATQQEYSGTLAGEGRLSGASQLFSGGEPQEPPTEPTGATVFTGLFRRRSQKGKKYQRTVYGSVEFVRPISDVEEILPEAPGPVVYRLQINGEISLVKGVVFTFQGERTEGERIAQIYREDEEFFAIFK